MGCVVWSGHSERFNYCCKCLGDVKIRIPLPAGIGVQFPSHPCQGGTDQTIVNQLWDRPAGWTQFFPAIFERCEIFSLLVDTCSRPIARSTRSLDAIHVVAGKGRVLCPPDPEIIRQFAERIRLPLAICRYGKAIQHEYYTETLHVSFQFEFRRNVTT